VQAGECEQQGRDPWTSESPHALSLGAEGASVITDRIRRIPVAGWSALLAVRSARRLGQWLGRIARPYHLSELDVGASFPLFVPNSAVPRAEHENFIIRSARNTIPALVALGYQSGIEPLRTASVDDFVSSVNGDASAAAELARRFNAEGSDKATQHDYFRVYAAILDRLRCRTVLEIGLGTNHPDVASSMGHDGRPGASARAFRDFLPNAVIHGADVDTRILFTEERIITHHVDTEDADSLERLDRDVPDELDLVIDDGLHSPDSNLRVLALGLRKVRVGGWVIIEDIGFEKRPIWELAASLLAPERFDVTLVESRSRLLFAVKRLQ